MIFITSAGIHLCKMYLLIPFKEKSIISNSFFGYICAVRRKDYEFFFLKKVIISTCDELSDYDMILIKDKINFFIF